MPNTDLKFLCGSFNQEFIGYVRLVPDKKTLVLSVCLREFKTYPNLNLICRFILQNPSDCATQLLQPFLQLDMKHSRCRLKYNSSPASIALYHLWIVVVYRKFLSRHPNAASQTESEKQQTIFLRFIFIRFISVGYVLVNIFFLKEARRRGRQWISTD